MSILYHVIRIIDEWKFHAFAFQTWIFPYASNTNELPFFCFIQNRNLFNFSPKHFFTDSSGAYWRERRLRPGMYTDGETVYEASYRYRDGRNGMHKVSTLKQFLSSSAVDRKEKEGIIKKLKEAAPDVVLEL